MKRNQIYKIYGKDYKEMTKGLLEVSGLSSMIPGDVRIGIKPNLVTPTPAEYGATTHPEVVAGIIEYLHEHCFYRIVILESSWVGDRTREAFEYCGYNKLAEEYHVELIDIQKETGRGCDCAGMRLKVYDKLDQIGFLINVPVMKGHGQTKITCALKNLKGLIPNSEKRRFHTLGLHKPIAHLAAGIRQDFIVIDHICGDLELEDGGNPIWTNCLMTSLDPVLTDSYVCHLLGYEPTDVEYIALAEELGCGSTRLDQGRISVFRKNPEGAMEVLKEFSAYDQDPFEVQRQGEDRLLDISYAIEDADSCSACYASLAPAILRIKEEGLYEKLTGILEGRIAVGQGFSGKTGKLGVGDCCRKFDRYVPGCPPREEDVYRMLMSMMEG